MSTETQLIHFDRARAALAEAHSIDEVKLIRDQAEAMRQYIKQQKGSLIMQNQAAEIKIRAERRAGEMLGEVERSEGGRPSDNSFHDETSYQKTLRENELSHITAHRWQLEADVPEEQLEQFIAIATEKAEEITSRAVLSMAMKIKNEAKKEPTSDEAIPSGLFEVIVVDPPWPYGGHYDSKHYFGRVASPYGEMSIEDIIIMDIPATDNCILWLWTTNKFMHDAYHILEAWAFEPKSILTWFKQRTGVGYWLRGQTEHCLLAVKGKPTITHTAQGTALVEKAGAHSQKPDSFYQLVESLCPGKKLEMFRRGEPRTGWEAHGNQRK